MPDNHVENLKHSRCYDLSVPMTGEMMNSPTHPGFTMALAARHGDSVRKHGLSGADELLVMSGHTGTHIDALCHVAVNGELHGGVRASEVQSAKGFSKLGVESIGPIVTRGVLFDFPKLMGVDVLEPGYRITAKDLEEASRNTDVEIEVGDAVLIRTGWAKAKGGNTSAYLGWTTGVPGPDSSAADWLGGRSVRVTGSDTIAYERIAPGAGHSDMPVHASLIVKYGVHIIECMNLEQMAEENIVTFGFVCAPLNLVGATGSPITPLGFVFEHDE